MLRHFTGLCAAAALLAMSGAAHAIKIFDTAPGSRADLTAATTDSRTYASETLLTTMVTEVSGDSTKYYNVGGTGTLVLSLPGDIGANEGDTYIVSIALDGMVFRTIPTVTGTGGTTAAFIPATGGAIGDKGAVFRMTTGSIDTATTNINLTAAYAVSESGGSVTVTLTNQTLLNIEGVSGTKTHGPANVIKVGSALKETPMANNLTATVESGFKKFAGDMGDVLVGHVGSITIGVNGHYVATDGDGSSVVNGLDDIAVTGNTTATNGVVSANSSVSFMGDFSFASKVFVHGDNDCGAEIADSPGSGDGTDPELADIADDIRMMEGTGDDAMVTGRTKPVSLDNDAEGDNDLSSFVGYLCIMVQGDDTDDMDAPRIPDTDAYTAMASYTALDNAAMGPMGMERMLGEINRDGTTVHIPYMTTYAGYNQRIVMSNRSNADAKYEITFRPEEGVMASGTDMATGMLMANSTVTMSAMDLVELSGGSRTAATIIVEADSKNIDVTSVTVNKESRDTDTVVHPSM